MARTVDFSNLEDAQERVRKAMAVPIGLTSPMWLAFGAAASAGVAWWWMTRWTRATNLEAMAGAARAQVSAVEALVERESEAAVQAVSAAESLLEAASVIEPKIEIIAEEVETEVERASDTAAETSKAAAERASEAVDDLTQLTGIGPKLAAALAARGIRTFAQLADWTEEQAQAFDSELSLKGRVARDAWIAQARRLAGS
jgi:predicted flap endonuclease-1-like 5' DNA nuclease